MIIVLFGLLVFIGLGDPEVTITGPTVRAASESDEWN
jgi:hypothetical protein